MVLQGFDFYYYMHNFYFKKGRKPADREKAAHSLVLKTTQKLNFWFEN